MSAEDTKDLKKTLGKVLDISGCKKDDVIDGLIHGHPSGLFQLIKHGKLVGCLVEQAMLKDKNNPYDNESKKFPPRLSLLLKRYLMAIMMAIMLFYTNTILRTVKPKLIHLVSMTLSTN